MRNKHDMVTNTRISRRRFTLMCQIAMLPAVWPAMKLVRFAFDGALDQMQSRNQSFDERSRPPDEAGTMALITTAIVRSGRSVCNPMVAERLEDLAGFVQPDGGIYTLGKRRESYETCLATMCFATANVDGRYNHILRGAAAFIRTCQWDESKGREPSDRAYGGMGYSRRRCPDLANTAFLLEVLRSCDTTQSNAAVEKALVFVSRCQNQPSANGAAASGHDWGFHYSCASGSSPRSCGVMTCIGLKSLLDAGVARYDVRVQAALRWFERNYDLDNNPGMGSAGLYHYYHACAKALHALGVNEIEDATGAKHNWRNDICAEIVRRQRADGSWANENGYWQEDDPHIATAHALLAVSYCQQPSAEPAQTGNAWHA